MPKKVDRQERRQTIAAAVGRIASERGMHDVSFREVASEAGVSVALVQHYFGTKENLLITTLDIHSAAMADRIGKHMAGLKPGATALDRLRVVFGAFIPVDAESRSAMVLYHEFAVLALTDDALRSAEAFRNGARLLGFLAEQLRSLRNEGVLGEEFEPELEAQALLALVLGLSLGVLLNQTDVSDANAALESHLKRLACS